MTRSPSNPDPEHAHEPRFSRGNPLHWLRGGVVTAVGALAAYLLMADDGQLRFGVPLGIAFVTLAAYGVMDLVGSFDDVEPPGTHVAARTTLSALKRPLADTAVALFGFALSLSGAASGLLRPWIWSVAVTLAFLALVVTVFQVGVALGPWALDERGLARPLRERHGFWVVVAASLLLLPRMGSYSLWDPWETHYGEVAREILARDDWISLWWAQDGWFWSKPVLDFWIQAIFMATLGVHYQPDQMLHGLHGAEAHPEWVVRAPIFLLTVLAMYILYKGVAKVFGRRAGLIGALVLATMPDWWLLAHQTMTDMPFVAPTTSAMGLMLFGLYTPAEERVSLYEVRVGARVLRLSAWHLVFGAILVCAIPQILYLLSRNVDLVLRGAGAHGFRAHWDEFKSGSGLGDCGLPGNEACAAVSPFAVPASLRGSIVGVGPSLMRLFGAYEPALQALTWTVILGFVLFLNWGERRARRIAYLGAWFFAAVGTMGKGPAGFALPILCGLAYVATTQRWRELARFELVSGLCIILAVAMPWWVAMFVRHGPAFPQRLIIHDMVDRAFSHVHDTNEGDDTSFRFYVWQLGYALFPWTGLAPLGLVYSLRRADDADEGRGQASILLLMWFVFAFALFSFMGTKFHHYILPAVPPVAMLIGVVLDDVLGDGATPRQATADTRDRRHSWARRGVYLGLLAAGALLAVLGIARAFPGSFDGDKPDGALHPPVYWLALLLCATGIACLVIARSPFARPPASTRVGDDPHAKAHEHIMFAAATVAGALLLGIVGRDLIIKPDGADQPGAIRFVHLFTYNYRRPWPDSLDFSAILTGFTAVGVGLGLALAVPRIRRHAVMAFLAFSAVWAAWGLDVYMVKTAPHWGQRELFTAYYANRAGPNEPVIAYQMNWKGENFYSGNRMPAFVSSGATFTSWLAKQRAAGVHVVFVILEHGRIGSLKGELQPKAFKELTSKAQNNKFVLVRAEI